MVMKIYRHFGSSHFDPDKFDPIKNDIRFSKPEEGGLWAVDLEHYTDWVNYVSRELVSTELVNKLNTWFDFTLKDDANVLELREERDFEGLPLLGKREGVGAIRTEYFLDFEELLRNGVDAVEAFIPGGAGPMYYHLYSWDVSSILILNPKILKEPPLKNVNHFMYSDNIKEATSDNPKSGNPELPHIHE